MSWEAWLSLGTVVLVFIGLAKNVGPADVLLTGGVVLLGLAGVITPFEVFAGFSNQGMLTVAALFIVAAGLRETGVLDAVGGRILGRTQTANGAMLRMTAPVVGMSAFLNNTPVVGLFMPIVTDWCRKHQISPSSLLIPLSYLAILGGTCTLIGTSTNLVVNGLMIKEGLPSMSLFELGYVGLPYAAIGLLYLLLIGRRLLPDRKDLLEQLGESPREFLVDMQIQPGCRLIGQRIQDAGLRRLPGLFLIEITRGDQIIAPVDPDQILREGDYLTFTGVVTTIVDLERIAGLVPIADEAYEAHSVAQRGRRLCEAVISNTSPLIGKTIRDANFRAAYNAAIVAVHRGGSRLKGRIGDIVLRAGDTLLLQTGPHFVSAHRNNPDFYLVSRVEEARPVRHDRASVSTLLLLGLIALMMSGYVPIVLAAFLAAGLMIATRCISPADARQSIDWQTLITIASALGIAQALQKTGAAEVIAHHIFGITEGLGPRGALAAVYLATMIFTELITNNAAAALIFPFAMALAAEGGFDPRPFAMAVAFAASASFATPIGYQTNMMVCGPGGYRFTDFLRVGIPLSLILFLVAIVLVPLIWPF